MIRCFPLIFILLSLSSSIFGQANLSVELREAVSDPEQRTSDTPVPLLIQGDAATVSSVVEQLGGKVKFNIGEFVSINLPLSAVSKLAESENIKQINGLLHGVNLNDSVRHYNNVKPVHEGIDELDRPYKGKGVVIGIIDSGVDYQHPDFFDDDGNNRVAYIWDQRMQGNGPDNFGYGVECDPESIANGNCPSRDYIGSVSHGTHVAGTAAGNDKRNNGLYSGMAPESTIIAVVYNGGNFGTSVVDGAKYIYDRANELNMPCVINLSAGSYSGTHDGKDIFTQALDALITEQPGRAFVNAAGNAGHRKIHLGYEVTQDTTFTWFKYRGDASQDVKFAVHADTADFKDVNFNFQADRISNLDNVGSTPFFNILQDYDYPASTTSSRKDTVFSNAGNNIGIVSSTLVIEGGTASLFVDIDKTTSAYYWRFSTTGSGKFDVYSGSRNTGTSDIIDTNLSFTEFPEIVNYKGPDFHQNIVGYFNASDQVISVGNYVSKTTWTNYVGDVRSPNFQVELEDLMFTSSNGPTRDNRTKPDLSSTGAIVISAGKLDYISYLQDIGAVNRLNVDTIHFRNWGTSMSAPAVSGGVALLLERYPTLSNEEIIKSVLNNTYVDSFTGTTPNNSWGEGKFDAYAMMTNAYVKGCMNENAQNYNPDATVDDGSCKIFGCTDPTGDNYNPEANVDDGSCQILGCTDPGSYNYDPLATVDDGTCFTPLIGDDFVLEFFPNPMVTTGVIRYAVPTDKNDELILQIINDLGQVLFSRTLSGTSGELTFDKQTSSLPGGLYYVRLICGEEALGAKKWVIQ